MATTYEACKDIINIQMETRKRKIEEEKKKQRTCERKRIGENVEMEGTARPFNGIAEKNTHTHTSNTYTHMRRNVDLYFLVALPCAVHSFYII